jgi:hypothetical protein
MHGEHEHYHHAGACAPADPSARRTRRRAYDAAVGHRDVFHWLVMALAHMLGGCKARARPWHELTPGAREILGTQPNA